MKIASVATFKSETTPQLSAFVADPSHQFAFSPEIAAALGVTTQPPISMSGGFVLQALMAATPQRQTNKNTLDVTEHITKIGALTLDFAKSQIPMPSAQLNGAIEGVEVALLSIAAAKAWSEVDEKGYAKAVLTTSSAALELLKMVKDVVPGLEKLGPALAVVSFLVKVGDEVCQVNLDMKAMSSQR